MPFLDWVNKNQAVSAAQSVPYHLLQLEHKGEVYKTNDDSREKNNVGELWAKESQGKRLYLMAVSKDDCGRSVAQQINELCAE